MVALVNTQENEIVMRVMEACSKRAAQDVRNYLGMSGIGDGCDRKLWLKVNGYPEHQLEGRIARVFDMGHAVEARVKAVFREAGYEITDEQLEFVDFDGRFRGHCDGIIRGITQKPHILEIKSANDESFKKFKKQGLNSKPVYYDQLQCYMGYSGLERGLFVVENKNSQDLYVERVYFDPPRFEEIKVKAAKLLSANYPPTIDNDYPYCNTCEFGGAVCEHSLKTCFYCKRFLRKDFLVDFGMSALDADICLFHVKRVTENDMCDSFEGTDYLPIDTDSCTKLA
jgi:hypothetical protein